MTGERALLFVRSNQKPQAPFPLLYLYAPPKFFLFILRWYLFAELDNIQSRGLANFMNHMHMLQHFTRFNVETYSLPPHVPYIQCTCSILAQITVVAICVKKSICRVHTYSCWDKDSKGKRKHKVPSLAFHSICNRKCLLYRYYH